MLIRFLVSIKPLFRHVSSMQYVSVLAIIVFCSGMHTCAKTAHPAIIQPSGLADIADVIILCDSYIVNGLYLIMHLRSEIWFTNIR